MTREKVLSRLRASRAAFDERVAAIASDALDIPPAGYEHSPKQIVAHVSAYEELIVLRLEAAREGRTTAFDRDREGWETFNDRVWRQSRDEDAGNVLQRSAETFDRLLVEVGSLSDQELNDPVGVAARIDPAWLDGRALWELVGVDGFEHYPMHFELLERAADAATGHS